MSVIGIPPFIEFDRTKGTLSGIDMDILKEIAKKLLFKVNIKPERTWGNYVNGTWSGTVGSVNAENVSLVTNLSRVFFVCSRTSLKFF